MKNKNKLLISSYVPVADDKVIFDTNVLINIFYPINFSKKTNQYEKLYVKLLEKSVKIFLSSIQISEFINRCIRFRFATYCDGRNLDFKKQYRNTDDYREHMEGILDIINIDIIDNFSFIDDGFSTMNYDNIFKYGFSYDFNDALISEIAKRENAYLITHDSDFLNYGTDLKIITANEGLLKFGQH